MPRSMRQIPSGTKKANSDSSSVTKESLISMISRGCHRHFIHPSVTRSHTHFRRRRPYVFSCHYSVTPYLSSSTIVLLSAVVRLLLAVSYHCDVATSFVLLFWLSVLLFSFYRCPLTTLIVSPLVRSE